MLKNIVHLLILNYVKRTYLLGACRCRWVFTPCIHPLCGPWRHPRHIPAQGPLLHIPCVIWGMVIELAGFLTAR